MKKNHLQKGKKESKERKETKKMYGKVRSRGFFLTNNRICIK